MTDAILKTFPAAIILNPTMGGEMINIELDREDGVAPTSSQTITIKAFSRTRDGYEWLNDFTIGADEKGGEPWAFGNAAILTAGKSETKVSLGYEIGGKIKIEGKLYLIEEAPNQNIGFVAI